jgi:hypothetical protein
MPVDSRALGIAMHVLAFVKDLKLGPLGRADALETTTGPTTRRPLGQVQDSPETS